MKFLLFVIFKLTKEALTSLEKSFRWLWCSRQLWAFAPLVVSTAGVPHADSLNFLEDLATQTVQAILRRHGSVRPAGGGGLGGRWIVCGRAGRCRVRRLPAVVFRGLGNVFPLLGFSRAYLVWFGSMIPGLYEFIQCTLSLSE